MGHGPSKLSGGGAAATKRLCLNCGSQVVSDRQGLKPYCAAHACPLDGCRKPGTKNGFCSSLHEEANKTKCQLAGCQRMVSCSPTDGWVWDFCSRAHAEETPCRLPGCKNRRKADPVTGRLFGYCSPEHSQLDRRSTLEVSADLSDAAPGSPVNQPPPAYNAAIAQLRPSPQPQPQAQAQAQPQPQPQQSQLSKQYCYRATPGLCRLCGAATTAINAETGKPFEFCCPQHARLGSPMCAVPGCQSVCASNPGGGFFPGCCRWHSASLQQPRILAPVVQPPAIAVQPSMTQPREPPPPFFVATSPAPAYLTPEQAFDVLASGAQEDTIRAAIGALQGCPERLLSNGATWIKRLCELMNIFLASPDTLEAIMRLLHRAVGADYRAITEIMQTGLPSLIAILQRYILIDSVLIAALPLLNSVLPDARRKFEESGFAQALSPIFTEHISNPRVMELVFEAIFLVAPSGAEQMNSLGALQVVLEVMGRFSGDADLMSAGSRALLGLTCRGSKGVLDKKAVTKILERAAKDHPTFDGVFLQTQDALSNKQSEEVEYASKMGVCSLVTGPRCLPTCEASHLLYCHKCCRCQWFRECFTCNTQNSRKWYCATCVKKHHHGHSLSDQFFLPGSCACTLSDCRMLCISAAVSKPFKRTPPSILLKRALNYESSQLQWSTVTSATGDDSFEFATVQQGSPLWNSVQQIWERPSPNLPKSKAFQITRIEMVHNQMLETTYDTRAEQLERRRGGESAKMFHFAAQDPDQTKVLDRLRTLFVPQEEFKKANFVFLWHGCAPATTKAICLGGMADLRRTDGGFFGGGVYLTPQSHYAALYATGLTGTKPKPTEQGEYTMLLAAGTIGLAYPLTRKKDYSYPDLNVPYSVSCYHCASPISQQAIIAYKNGNSDLLKKELNRRDDKALKPSFDTHFVGVSSKYKFQASPPDEIQYDEVVTAESQVMPIAIVYFKPVVQN